MNRFENSILKKILPLLLGLACLGGGIYMKFFEHNGLQETTAVIERIETVYHGTERDDEHDVYVKYTVDGTEYHSRSDYYAEGYEEGKTVRIWYDPSDPGVIHGDSENFGIYVLCVGAVITAAGVVMMLRR